MNPWIQFKTTILRRLAALVVGYFVLSPVAQAVLPPPDGGYAGENTAEGTLALLHLNGGTNNTGVGWAALCFDVTGNLNTAVGAGSLLFNTGDQNTATGAGALLSNTTGPFNTANGVFALFSNTTGYYNTATGTGALRSNTTGVNNTANGVFALFNNTIGYTNVAIGEDALFSNSSGNGNTAIGLSALLANTTGNGNTALGIGALDSNTTGSSNIALGTEAGINVTTASNVICIGIPGANVSGSFYVANVFETSVDPDNLPVYIDFTGRLGTQSSSRRFKDNITSMEKASEAILSLRPVTFHYKNDTKAIPKFGLIAEEVAKVNPDLVVRDKEGKPYSVRYDQVNAMLLNEFLKEHRKVQELETNAAQQQRNFAQQQKQIDALSAALQKVSAQLEVKKPAPRTVLNNQ